jgi:hypothetical protein
MLPVGFGGQERRGGVPEKFQDKTHRNGRAALGKRGYNRAKHNVQLAALRAPVRSQSRSFIPFLASGLATANV